MARELKRLNVNLPPLVIERLERYCEQRQMTKTQVIDQLIRSLELYEDKEVKSSKD